MVIHHSVMIEKKWMVLGEIFLSDHEYSKTCLKGPLSKRPKNWFSRPIIA